MKSTELKPTKENLISTLKDDLLDRNRDLYCFADLLNNINESYSIALDSPWGSGKTFFVKQMAMLLNIHNPQYQGEFKKYEDDLKTYIAKSIPDNKFFPDTQRAIYYDAWSNDNETDPILSILYAIAQSEDCNFTPPKNRDWIGIGASIIDLTGKTSFTQLRGSCKSQNFFENISKNKDLNILVNDFLNSLIDEHANRLVIFIDELDRCRPTFAVELLERIKHYFNNDRITFVFSINKEQLVHTIKRFYGEQFDACRYLERFFDYPVTLSEVDFSRIFKTNRSKYYRYFYLDVRNRFMNVYQFSIREAQKYEDIVDRALGIFRDRDFAASYSSTEKGFIFSLYLFVPIIIGLKLIDNSHYVDFISGNDNYILHTLFDGTTFKDMYYLKLIDSKDPVETPYSLSKKLYDIIFSGENNDVETLNDFYFEATIRERLLRTVSSINITSNYD